MCPLFFLGVFHEANKGFDASQELFVFGEAFNRAFELVADLIDLVVVVTLGAGESLVDSCHTDIDDVFEGIQRVDCAVYFFLQVLVLRLK